MPSTRTTPDEIQHLRWCVRELVALSALPAIWANANPPDIAKGLAEVLQRTLSLDFLYVRVNRPADDAALEALCTNQPSNGLHTDREIGQLLSPWLNFDAVGVHSISNPCGAGTARLAVVSLGHDNHGFVAAGSERSGFPTEIERLLLGVSGNQAAIVLERKWAEEALKEADRRKDEFLAMLAHELRNPLAPIRSAIGVLQRLGPPDPTLQWARNVIERQSGHLTRLVDDLLDVSRITQGKIALQKEPIDLIAVIGRAVEASRPMIDARKQQLNVSLPDQMVRLEGDVTRLSQVISNLLNNAAKYTEDGGQIWLSAELKNGEVAFRIRDAGIGISPDFLPHVFELFTQADRSLDRSYGGLGIGLTLVRTLVQMHGGTVEAFSEGLGHGSEFVVRLPMLIQTQYVAEDGAMIQSKAGRPVSHRILIIDDNVDSAESLALLLQLNGHDVRFVQNGSAALTLSRTFQPKVILLDIGLPGMDGYKVARKLREQPETREAVLVALTGYGRPEDRERSKEAGFDYHLVKPVDHGAVQALVDSYPG